MRLDVYTPDNETFLGSLAEAHGIGFTVELAGPGAAQFSVDVASAADLDLLIGAGRDLRRRIVRFHHDGADLFAAIVQDIPAELAGDIEPAAGQAVTVMTFECPGLLAWLGYREGGAVLWPHGGLDGRQQNPRMFGWLSGDYDDSGWAAVAGDPDRVDGRLSTEGWPDPSAVAYTTPLAPTRALYRRYMPAAAAAAGPARLYVVGTVMTGVRVWVDTDLVLEKPAGKTGLFHADVPYEDIEHIVAVEVIGGTGRWGLSWVKLDVTVDGDGNETFALGSVLRRTFDADEFPDADSQWLSYEGDLPYPGVTVGYVMGAAVDEATARHGVPWTYDFTASLDSAGATWETVFTRGFRLQELGLLLDECQSVEGEAEMTPAGVLRYHRQRGADKTATVTVTSPFGLSLSGRGPQATRWLYETQGGLGTITNDAAETTLGVVMEQFVQLGSDIDPEAIAAALVKQLVEDGRTLDEVDVDLPDDVVPFVDVVLGDRVMCDGRDGPVAVRLTALTATVTDEGHVEWQAAARPVIG